MTSRQFAPTSEISQIFPTTYASRPQKRNRQSEKDPAPKHLLLKSLRGLSSRPELPVPEGKGKRSGGTCFFFTDATALHPIASITTLSTSFHAAALGSTTSKCPAPAISSSRASSFIFCFALT